MADPLASILGGAGMVDDAEDDGGDSKEDAAKDLLSAIERKDAKAVSLAFERLYEACKSGEGSYEDDDEEG